MKKYLAFLFCTLFINMAIANKIDKTIDAVIKKSKQPIHIGIIIRKAKTGKIIYANKENYLFAPASTQKLLTATAALSYLGPDFSFKTKLFTNGKVKGHVFKGDILIKFTGDPELEYDDLEELLSALKKLNIKKIEGKIYLDVSDYDNVYYPPGWLWDDLSYSYAAPLSTANIDKNAFVLRLKPNSKIGKSPTLDLNIPDNIIHIRNNVKTTQQYDKYCPLTIYSDALNHYTFSGCLNKSWGRQLRNLSVRDPLPYAEALIKQAMIGNQLAFSGKVEVGKLNRHYKLLTEHRSAPLRKILKDMLKKSDNLIADTLLKQIGHRYFKKPGSWQNGVRALQKILADSGINFKENLIDDGAGLSRYDLITPAQMSKLLQYIYKKPALRHIIIQALPIAGIDGTLVERMISEANNKRVRAKTGSMTSVTALAGYIYSKHLGVLSFVIMINGFVGKHHPYNRLEDHICRFLAHYPTGKTHG